MKSPTSALGVHSVLLIGLLLFLPSLAAAVWSPSRGISWDIQITPPIDPNVTVAAFEIDLFNAPQSLIDTLRAQGKIVICYFSAGSYEEGRPDSSQFPDAVLGKRLSGWKDEKWLNVRQIDLLAPIMRARMDLAVQRKCDAVDPDNLDGFEADTGFAFNYSSQLLYNRWIASEAHARDLSVALKNDLRQLDDLIADFDFAVNEQCFEFGECALYSHWLAAGKAVLNIEYKGPASSFCSTSASLAISTWLKGHDLNAGGQSCFDQNFQFAPGWTEAPGLEEDLSDYEESSGSRAIVSLLLLLVLTTASRALS